MSLQQSPRFSLRLSDMFIKKRSRVGMYGKSRLLEMVHANDSIPAIEVKTRVHCTTVFAEQLLLMS